jgi:hypothetical protein
LAIRCSRLAGFSKEIMGPEFSNRHEGMIIREDKLLRTTPIVEWMDNGRPFRTMTPTYDS